MNKLNAAAIFGSRSASSGAGNTAESRVAWINGMLRSASDLSMPKNRGFYKKSAYWWNSDVQEMRSVVIRRRRK